MKITTVVKAVYDYRPSGDGELSLMEGCLYYVLDAVSDPDWWLSTSNPFLPPADWITGRIPSNYVEEALPLPDPAVALYDYQAQTSEELALTEGEQLIIYDNNTDPEWIFVRRMNTEEFGLVPSTYISMDDADVKVEHPPAMVSASTVASAAISPLNTRHSIDKSHQLPIDFENDFDDASIMSPNMQSPVKTISSETSNAIEYFPVTAIVKILKKQRNRQGLLGVGDGHVYFVNEKDKAVIQQWGVLEIIKCQQDKKHLLFNVGTTAYDFQFQKKGQIPGIIEAIQFAQKLQAKANAGSATASPAVTGKGLVTTSPLVVQAPSAVKSPAAVQATAAVKAPVLIHTPAVQPSAQQMKATPASALKVEITNKSQSRAIAIYEYTAQTEEEISILENEEFIVLDASDPEWTLVELASDSSVRGLVPTTYIERIAGDQKSLKSPVHPAPESPKKESTHPAVPLPPRNVESAPIPSLPSRHVAPESASKTVNPPPSLPSRNVQTLSPVKPSYISPQTFSPVKSSSDPTLPQRTLACPVAVATSPIPHPPRSANSPVIVEESISPPRPPRNESVSSAPPPRPARNENPVKPEIISSLPTWLPRNDEFAAAPAPTQTRNDEYSKQELSHRTPSSQSETVPPPRPARTTSDVPPPRQPPPSTSTSDFAPKAPPRISSHEEKPPALASWPSIKTESSPTPPAVTASQPPVRDKILRMWTDRSGSFKVEAYFIGFVDGKVQLHKVNGVKIAVPIEKLCQEDSDFIASLDGEKDAIKSVEASSKSVVVAKLEPSKPFASSSEFVYNKFDWLAFFVDCGVSSDDTKTYARKFVKENMDLATLPHLDRDMLKDLNVASGDIIRIIAKKPMSVGYSTSSNSVSKPITDTSFFEAVSSSSTTRKSAAGATVSSLFEDPATKAKILEAEKQAQQKNLDILLGKKMLDDVSTTTKTQAPTLGLQQQMAEDQRLAMELQEKELRSAGIWKDTKKPTASSTSRSSKKDNFTDGSLPWPETFSKAPAPVKQEPQVAPPRRTSRSSAPVPAAPTVDPKAVFDAAKVLSRADSSNDLNGPRKPSSMAAPLIPTPSNIVPMAVNISTGDPPRPMSMNGGSMVRQHAPIMGIAQQPQASSMGMVFSQQQPALQPSMQRNPTHTMHQPQMISQQQPQMINQQQPQMITQQHAPTQQSMSGVSRNLNPAGSLSYGNTHMIQQPQQQQWPNAMQQNTFPGGASNSVSGMGMAPMNHNPLMNMAPLAPLGFPPMPNLLPNMPNMMQPPMVQMSQTVGQAPQDDRYSVFKDIGGQPMNGGFAAPMTNAFQTQQPNQVFPPTNHGFHQPQGYRPPNQHGWM